MTATPFSWDQWWPELDIVHIIELRPKLTGTSFDCTFRAPIGYKLHCGVIIGETIPSQRVVLHVQGDLRGTVICILHNDGDGTRVDVTWDVETTKPWMNYLNPVLRPAFVWGHHAVMRSGERGLRQFIATK